MADFYMDPFTGNDNFDGDAPDKAWRTLMKASSYTFMPGDRLLFKAGGAAGLYLAELPLETVAETRRGRDWLQF